MTVNLHALNNPVSRNNALMAAGTLLGSGIMGVTAYWVNSTVMGSNAISPLKVGIGVASAAIISVHLLEKKIPHINPFSIAISKTIGATTILALAEPCGWPMAVAIGTATAALLAGKISLMTFSPPEEA